LSASETHPLARNNPISRWVSLRSTHPTGLTDRKLHPLGPDEAGFVEALVNVMCSAQFGVTTGPTLAALALRLDLVGSVERPRRL
jgi:hypothetical protein